jgi:hypothetical protein
MVWWLAACSSPPCGVEAGETCTGTTTTTEETEPEDTAVELGDLGVEAKVEECTGPEWLYSFDLTELPREAELAITGTLDDGVRADEVHPVELTATAHWEANATLVVLPDEEPIPGSTTRFACDRQDAMTWRLFTWDGLERRSCLVWGAEPALLEIDGCRRW